MAMVLQGRPVVCEAAELVYFALPTSNTCGTFAESFLQSAPGYIANPNESRAGELCGYCRYSSGEDVGYRTCHAVEQFALILDWLAVSG
jgi:ATP-binding cassette subfamily G (WHITE) protein 2 (SNQ2)